MRHAEPGAAFVKEKIPPFGLAVVVDGQTDERGNSFAGSNIFRVPSVITQLLEAQFLVTAVLVETRREGAHTDLVGLGHLRHREARARHRGGHQSSGEMHNSKQFRQGNHSLNPSTPDGSTERARGKATAYGGALETPGQIVANVARLGEESGRGLYLDRRRLETLAKQANGVRRQLDIARGIDPEGRNPRTGRLRAQYNQLMAEMRRGHGAAVAQAAPETLGADKMAERMGWPGRAGHAANAVFQVLGGWAAAGAEFASEARTSASREWQAMFKKIRAGVPATEISGGGRNLALYNVLDEYVSATPEERERMERMYAPYTDPRENTLYQWGEEARARIQEAFPSNPRYKGEFFTDVLPRALANAAVEGGLTLALGGLGVPGPLVAATLGVTNESSTQFRDALERGEPIDEAYRQFGFGALMGLTDGLPLAELLGRADKTSGGAVSGLLRDALAEGTKAAMIEAIQQAGELARFSKTVEPDEVAAAFTSEAIREVAFSLLGAKK